MAVVDGDVSASFAQACACRGWLRERRLRRGDAPRSLHFGRDDGKKRDSSRGRREAHGV